MFHRIAICLTGLTAACAVVEVEPPGAVCAPGSYEGLAGQNIAAVTLPAELQQRIVKPGEMVTQDYVAERLTIYVDGWGKILSASCG